MSTHYVYGSGEHGCLYDSGPYYAKTLKEAVECLAETFSLGRVRRAMLRHDMYLDLNPRRDGASYCEITPCSCDEPWEHTDDPAERARLHNEVPL